MNHGQADSENVSLLDYVKNAVIDLMLRANDTLKKKQEPYLAASTDESEHSEQSEAETERKNHSKQVELYQKIIEEYLGTRAKKASWHKNLLQARGINNSNFRFIIYLFILSLCKVAEDHTDEKEGKYYAETYSRMEEVFFQRAAGAQDNNETQKYRARGIFCIVAYDSFRNSNSSSHLERSFRDCTMATDGRRCNLRNGFKIFYFII